MRISMNNETLIFSSVIVRHGNSSLKGAMPLFNHGKDQMYRTGQFLRRRYHELLGDGRYSFGKVYILSTDTERAIMSAQSTLAGLFPPTMDDKWNDKILWQPIPVRTMPKELDIFFRGGRPCPKYWVRYKYYMEESPEALEIWEKYGKLFGHLSEVTGMNVVTIEDIANIYRRLSFSQNKLDGWVKEVMEPNGPIEYINGVVQQLRGTPELVRLRSGFLLREILAHNAQKINSTLYPDLLLWIYSAHSSTIVPILNGLGIYELGVPPYASSLHFELYRNANNEHYMQFFYRKPDEEYPTPLNVPGCGTKWTLEQFDSIHGELIPGDFDLECQT